MAEASTSPIESVSGPNPNPCPICLGPFVQDSYLDRCFHKFCYNCILQWSKSTVSKHSSAPSSLKCPLCKTEYFSIVHGYDGTSFQRHYVGKELENYEFFSEAHKYRLKSYSIEPGDLADKLHVSRYWKFRKYLGQNRFLRDWLRREIQAVMQQEDVDVVVHHILGVIDSLRRGWMKNSRISSEVAKEEFRVIVSDAALPFLKDWTNRFVNEVELFLASGLNIDAFDDVYMKHLGWKLDETSEDNHDQPQRHASVVPYKYIIDEDSDQN